MNAIHASELSTTARDLGPILREFREPFDADVRKLVDESWAEICAELALHDESEDVVVLISDAREAWPPRRLPYLMHSVIPRPTATSITLTVDPRVADWLAGGRRKRGQIDVVVELRGQLTTMRLDYTLAPHESMSELPTLDESRSFVLWNVRRAQRARYVFLDTGEAVLTWTMLSALLGIDDLMLDALLSRASEEDRGKALAWTTLVRRGSDIVRCVRIDAVESFLEAIEKLGGAR